MKESIKREISTIYKADSSRVLATLVKILGDLDLAEEALHEAFSIALEKWPNEGVPQNPYSWLVSTGKFKAIDSLRRVKRGKELIHEKFTHVNETTADPDLWDTNIIDDDHLKLIFLCSHPMLPLDSRIALSLRDVCGMTTKEIARAYLVSAETIKKRITRAKILFKEKKFRMKFL